MSVYLSICGRAACTYGSQGQDVGVGGLGVGRKTFWKYYGIIERPVLERGLQLYFWLCTAAGAATAGQDPPGTVNSRHTFWGLGMGPYTRDTHTPPGNKKRHT